MRQRFAGKRAVVTGGAPGIGEATVRRLHAEGAHVLIADLRTDAIGALADELSSERIAGHNSAAGSTAAKSVAFTTRRLSCGSFPTSPLIPTNLSMNATHFGSPART